MPASDAAAKVAGLAEQLHGVFFDHGIRQDFVRDLRQLLVNRAFVERIVELNVKVLSLPDAANGAIAKSVERRGDRLALRIEDTGLEVDVYACFHIHRYCSVAIG